jgi:hypothetical protein
VSPAGFEGFFEEVSALPGPPDVDAVMAIAAKAVSRAHAECDRAPMIFHQFRAGGCLSYLLACERSHVAALVDPELSLYGITGNFRALKGFRNGVAAAWRMWLNRRSQRARMHWARFEALLQRHPLCGQGSY